jgi:hypothetical protein
MSQADAGMTPAIVELKTRARLRLNALRRGPGAAAPSAGPQADAGPAAAGIRLRDCLDAVARDLGFAHWEHARSVLGGLAAPGDDLGTFWHAPHSGILLNEWFARLDEARAAVQRQPAAFLLPYRRQFVVVQADFVRELGLDPADAAWEAIARDLVRGYGTPAWQALARRRMDAPAATFEPGARRRHAQAAAGE